MKKTIYILPFILLTLLGCGTKVNEEYLIGGTWVATTGYEESKVKDIPYCMDFMMKGLEFKDEGVVYSILFDEDYTYYFEDSEDGTAVVINRRNAHYTYYIDKIDDDAIGLTGGNLDPNLESCYLERQD